MTQSVVSKGHAYQYLEEGFVVLSGLIPKPVVQKAEDTMWRCIEETYGIRRADSTTWNKFKDPSAVDIRSSDPDLVACVTPEVLRAAAQLGGHDPAVYPSYQIWSRDKVDTMFPSDVDMIFAINVFPMPGPWQVMGAHIDGANDHMTFRGTWRIAVMIYLADIGPQGGGTIVWPRSHRKIEAMARSQPERYRFVGGLNQDARKLDLGEPFEVTAKQGDVLFFDGLCAHSKSVNLSSYPRFAIHMKW